MNCQTEATNQIINSTIGFLSYEQVNQLKSVLDIVFHDYQLYPKENFKSLPMNVNEFNQEILNKFLVSRVVNGMAESSLKLYKYKLSLFIDSLEDKRLTSLTSDDINWYLAGLKMQKKQSNTTLRNTQLIIKSLFSWMVTEEYIKKDPSKSTSIIKLDTIKESPFTQADIELLHNGCTNWRDKSLIEFLLSTGCRVSEAVSVNRDQLDFEKNQLMVIGKGGKPRMVYLSDRSIIYLRLYLKTRTDDNEALFVSLNSPHSRLTKDGVETILKGIGAKAQITNVHPHRFRRTMCCGLLNKGMPIQEVQPLMGHSTIDTTLIYYNVNDDSVKHNFQKINNI